MPTADELRALAAKARRLMAGHTSADIAMLEAYAQECEAKAAEADLVKKSDDEPPPS